MVRWGQSDGVSECFELSDVAAFPGVRVGVAAEVIGAEIMELCVRVLKQVPDDDEQRTSDGDDGAFLAPPPGEPSVALAQEGIRSSDGKSPGPGGPHQGLQ